MLIVLSGRAEQSGIITVPVISVKVITGLCFWLRRCLACQLFFAEILHDQLTVQELAIVSDSNSTLFTFPNLSSIIG